MDKGAGKTVKVAILGGGMAGVAAAWTLAHATGDVKYEITVYDADWRLGGKCASGHDLQRGMRIDEHGIHILLGFYSQVLRILRDCYAELDPTLGFRKFPDVLEPGDQLQLPDMINGSWTFWTIDFPPNDLLPGDADPEHRDFLGALLRAVEALVGMITSYEAAAPKARPIAAKLKAAVPAPAGHAETLLRLAGIVVVLEELLAHPPTLEDLEIDARHAWMGIWFGATNLLGILRGRLFSPADFQTPELNAKDYKTWLQENGGKLPSPDLTYDSPIVNAVYDLVFSRAVQFAAGAALYDVLLMLLLYNGHVFYRMAGTGDVIFGPLYFALRARGVRFRFQHTVTDVRLGPPGPDGQQRVAEIDITGDDAERTVEQIFVKVGTQWSWPMTPLVDNPTHAIKLGPGDFDYVVSAIPLGALKTSMPSLMELPVLAKACDAKTGIVTIPTQGLQLWFDQTLEELGWDHGRMMLGSFARPFNSCADMAQALPFETLPGEKAVMYMSDVYDGQVLDPVAAAAQVRQQSIAWITQSLPTLLPRFSWQHLLDPQNGLGSNRLDAQYWRANISGTELYVASAPGTVALRPAADGSGVANLLLASDWVITEENQGCVEGASRSGVKAAQALDALAQAESDQPVYVQNDGDWVFPGPVALNGARAHAFPFLADGAALAALCARYSVGGATVRPWLAAIPLVLVYGCASADIRSLDPFFQGWGELAEREVGVFVPVVVEKDGTSFVALLCPYLYVDNGATLSAGREIYGLPKELATFPDWPYGGDVPLPLTVTGLVLPQKGTPATAGPILTVKQLAEVPIPGLGNLLVHVQRLWDELTGASDTVPLVALKQFHSIENGATACYQALVRCEMVPNVTDSKIEAGLWEISLPRNFFPAPSATLGLADGAKTLVSIKASLDFTLTLGTVVA
jgi:uncharacterized protein with NAD-binding domain and iron-sulfur cluster